MGYCAPEEVYMKVYNHVRKISLQPVNTGHRASHILIRFIDGRCERISDDMRDRLGRTYGQKFIRIELHDPDRAIDEEKNRIAKGLMRWQMKYFGSPYAITASTVDIGTAELEKILREYLQASREKSAAN